MSQNKKIIFKDIFCMVLSNIVNIFSTSKTYKFNFFDFEKLTFNDIYIYIYVIN